MTPLRIIFAASGEFAVPTLRTLVDAGHSILKVVTQPDRPAGRGRTMTMTATAQSAEGLGLSGVRTDDVNSLEEIRSLAESADVMVVIAFGQKIGEELIHKPRFGAINLHASRLPKYRGAAPINWAILGGETVTGNSVIRLAQKMDAGAILGQSELVIGEVETAGELHDRLAVDGAPLVLSVLQALADGTVVEREQDPSAATLAKKLSREAARIDWGGDAGAVARQIRGMYPWPGCRVEVLEGEKVVNTVTLVRAKQSGETSGTAEGGMLVDFSEKVGVAAGGGGIVDVIEVQPAGKRGMPIEAYRRGHRWNAGMRLRAI
jgi:methionyl-tRNA formyltransferase